MLACLIAHPGTIHPDHLCGKSTAANKCSASVIKNIWLWTRSSQRLRLSPQCNWENCFIMYVNVIFRRRGPVGFRATALKQQKDQSVLFLVKTWHMYLSNTSQLCHQKCGWRYVVLVEANVAPSRLQQFSFRTQTANTSQKMRNGFKGNLLWKYYRWIWWLSWGDLGTGFGRGTGRL